MSTTSRDTFTSHSGVEARDDLEVAPVVAISQLRKTFRREGGAEVHAVNDVTLSVSPGEFVVLLGPSGCGKTTLLRCIAGLEVPDAGTIALRQQIHFDGSRSISRPPESRRLSMVFQSYALWPHMTVFDNVAYPLRCRKVNKAEIGPRVTRALEEVSIEHLSGQYAGGVSGGQQQRVALARALVTGDDILLFDEPLSNVDAKVRAQVRRGLKEMQREHGFSAVYVTHDQDEAMELADRVVVMEHGVIVQNDKPRVVYEQPASRYVANFVGSINELECTILDTSTRSTKVTTALGAFECPGQSSGLAPGTEAVIAWRPERTLLSTEPIESGPCWRGEVIAHVFMGALVEYKVRTSDVEIIAWLPPDTTYEIGQTLWVGVRGDGRILPNPTEPNQPHQPTPILN